MITVENAERIIRENAPRLPVATVSLADTCGRELREDIAADRDYPPYDRVTMDGIAVCHSSSQRFHVERIARAGQAQTALKDRSSGCIEIMTGAVLPRGCDTVIPYEHLEIANGAAVLKKRAVRGQFVHRKGADRKKGALLLLAGRRLLSPQVAIVASTGRDRVRVTRMPSVAVISTGDEIIETGIRVAAHQVRPSNAHGIAAALRGIGCEVETLIVGDVRRSVFRVLGKALRTRDLIIVSGGVSMGKADFVPGVLQDLGVRPLFHGVSQRPGRPFWFGVSRDKTPVYALPGNPASSLVCFHRYVLPTLLPREPEWAALGEKIVFEKPLTFFLPVHVACGKDGKLRATPLRYGGSGDLNAVGDSDGFVELAKNRNTFPVGHVARFWRWAS